MENRSLSVAAGLIALALAMPALAGTKAELGTPEQRADWSERSERAKGLEQEGKTGRQAAKDRYHREYKACFGKFRVTDCQQEARQRYVQTMNEARRREAEGKAIELQVRKEERSARELQQTAEAPGKAAELKDRQATVQAQENQDRTARNTKLQQKEAQAKVGSARRAADARRVQAKRERHEREVAEKMARAERRAAENAAKKKTGGETP